MASMFGAGWRSVRLRRAAASPAAALLLGLGACATAPRAPAPSAAPLASVVDSVTTTPPLDRATWGIEVFDPLTRRPVYQHDAGTHFIPASNTKLVVTAVALGELGPDYRYRTELFAEGGEGGDVDRLLVVGRGDPTLSARFHTEGPSPLEMLADSVALAGIRRIGELVVDATWFDSELVNSTWEVGDLPWSYAAPVAAFAVDEGTMRIVVEPAGRVGDPARVHALAPAGAVDLENRVVTGAEGTRRSLEVVGGPATWMAALAGSVPVGGPPDTVVLAVADPVAYAQHRFRQALEDRGVTVDGMLTIRDSIPGPEGARGDLLGSSPRRIATWTSPPLTEIVAAILQPSQNWIAEQLLRTLGAERGEEGSWREGLRVERRHLIEVVGIDSTAFWLRDGSGLSAQNLLTPRAIVDLLDHVRRQPWGTAFKIGLAQPGVEGTTLSRRLTGLEGRLFAKTGTITHVNSLSGYVRARDGRELIFSIMSNASGRPAAEVRGAIDRIVTAIVGEGGAQ